MGGGRGGSSTHYESWSRCLPMLSLCYRPGTALVDFWGPQRFALSRVSSHQFDKDLEYILREYVPEVVGYYAQQAPSCGWHLNTLPGSHYEYKMPALFEEVAFHASLYLTEVDVIQRNRVFSYFHGDVLRTLLGLERASGGRERADKNFCPVVSKLLHISYRSDTCMRVCLRGVQPLCKEYEYGPALRTCLGDGKKIFDESDR